MVSHTDCPRAEKPEMGVSISVLMLSSASPTSLSPSSTHRGIPYMGERGSRLRNYECERAYHSYPSRIGGCEMIVYYCTARPATRNLREC